MLAGTDDGESSSFVSDIFDGETLSVQKMEPPENEHKLFYISSRFSQWYDTLQIFIHRQATAPGDEKKFADQLLVKEVFQLVRLICCETKF